MRTLNLSILYPVRNERLQVLRAMGIKGDPLHISLQALADFLGVDAKELQLVYVAECNKVMPISCGSFSETAMWFVKLTATIGLSLFLRHAPRAANYTVNPSSSQTVNYETVNFR